jgi:hypothetical protein
LRVPRLIKLNRQFFAIRHLTEIRQIRAHNWHTISARQMSDSTATRGRRIRHDGDGRLLEKVRQSILMDVTGELDIRIPGVFLFHRLDIARRLRMIASPNHQSRIWQHFGHQLKCVDHQLEPFIRSPLAKGQNAMLRITAPRKIRAFGLPGQNAMRPQMHIIAAIFFVENLAITRHEHRHRIRQQKHPGSDRSCHTISARMPHPGIFQIDGIHQMMQSDMRVAATHARQHWGEEPRKSNQRIAAECAEKKIEPHHVGLQFPERA